MTFKRFITAVLLLSTVVFLFNFKKLEIAMIVGAGSKAKFLCSNVFISHRTPASVLENEACNATRNIGFLGLLGDVLTMCDVDQKDQSASCRLLWIKRKAVFQEHFGATLLHGTGNAKITDSEKSVRLRKSSLLSPMTPEHESNSWPAGDLISKGAVADNCFNELNRLLDNAFDDSGKDNPARTHGVVIVYNGQLIAERYATDLGYGINTPHYGWSMTKSVASILVGILVKQEKLDIYSPAPIDQWKKPNDPRQTITTDQLLRMRSGLEFNEDYDNPISDVNDMLLGNHRSMVAFAASKTLIAEPDTLWQYSTGTANLLGAVIRNNMNNQPDYENFARIELFDKLGMHTAIIETDQSGNIVTGAYMWASPRDWARFGLFCLQNGRWENEQILPEHWMKYATTTTPSDPMAPYGAQFWLNSKKNFYPSLPADLYECRGKDIQRVTIIPSEKLIVARFGYTPNEGGWDHEGFVGEVIKSIRR